MKSKNILNPKELEIFVGQVSRSELWDNPRIYLKAVRATLLALGYNEDFVEIKVRDILERTYLH